jgi:hypothetical protein
VERAVFLGAVPLGGQQRAPRRVVADRVDGPFDQEDVGFLAGFEDAELGIDRRLFRHYPVGPWFRAARAALDIQPGGPPLVRAQSFIHYPVLEDEGVGRVRFGLVAGEFGPAGVDEVREFLLGTKDVGRHLVCS